MKCPKCSISNLVERKVKGKDLMLDLCPGCKGMWFDGRELPVLLNVSERELTIPSYAPEQPILCPRCDKSLYAFPYPMTMVVVDVCKQCDGVWLDAGEFKEIQEVNKALRNIETRQNEDKLTCPKCGYEQLPSEECVRCGVIFSRYHEAQDRRQSMEEEPEETDDIPPEKGFKGSLLRFINGSISALMP